MIIRIFVALLALNMVAFVVRAEAAERTFEELGQPKVASEEIVALQGRLSGVEEVDVTEAVTELGSRLLSLSLVRDRKASRQYASDPAEPDHGIALLDEGACLNLKWKF